MNTKQEKALMEAAENDEFISLGEIEQRREFWQKTARHNINAKRVRISLAMPEHDLARLKALALRRGMPYQTLINSLSINISARKSRAGSFEPDSQCCHLPPLRALWMR